MLATSAARAEREQAAAASETGKTGLGDLILEDSGKGESTSSVNSPTRVPSTNRRSPFDNMLAELDRAIALVEGPDSSNRTNGGYSPVGTGDDQGLPVQRSASSGALADIEEGGGGGPRGSVSSNGGGIRRSSSAGSLTGVRREDSIDRALVRLNNLILNLSNTQAARNSITEEDEDIEMARAIALSLETAMAEERSRSGGVTTEGDIEAQAASATEGAPYISL